MEAPDLVRQRARPGGDFDARVMEAGLQWFGFLGATREV